MTIFSRFKLRNEKYEEGNQWHHIVGQHEYNLRKFGAKSIHNTNNLVEIPKELYHKINEHYNSKSRELGGLTESVWLKAQSFEAQHEYGKDLFMMNVIKAVIIVRVIRHWMTREK